MWVTKVVPSFKDKSYCDCPLSLNLSSLLCRRRRTNKIMVYLIIRGLKGISHLTDCLVIVIYQQDAANGYKVYKNHCHLKKFFFSKE